MPPDTTIHIVDDDHSFRTAIGGLLSASGYGVALYNSARDFLEKLSPASSGCILLDVQMPGLSGLELQSRLKSAECSMPIIFLTGHADIPTAVRTMKAGAQDFLCKPIRRDDLIRVVEEALANAVVEQRRRERLRVLQARLGGLTLRENQIFALIVRGKLNKQIAYELGTSERTIKAHRHAVMEKLNTRSVAELVLIAEHLGKLPPTD